MRWRPRRNPYGWRFGSSGRTTSSGRASTSSRRWPGRPTPEAAAGRLLKNQEDIGAAIVGFYGQAAGDGLTALLKEHIMIAVDLVAAAKSGDKAAFATHDARWTANIREIARFLAGANPNWPEKDVFDLLALHLKLTKDEAVARIDRRLGRRREGVRRHLHRDHGRRRRPPRRDRGAVPRPLRRDGSGVMPLEVMEASPVPATLPIGAPGPAFEGLLGTDGRRYGSVELRRPRGARADLLVESLPDGQGLRRADERPAA